MRLTAKTDGVGRRLDIWLSKCLPELSRSRIQSLIKSGYITVNGRRVRAHSKVAEGMEVEIEIPPPAPTELAGENIPLDVLYEDADIIVVNKPAGLVVHPAAGHVSGTLVNALLYHCSDLSGIGGELRPGIVHRLDKDTSGAMVAAKNELAFAHLTRQFRNGQVRKEYLALVHGAPSPITGRIETLIGRSRHDRKKMSAGPSPRRSGYGRAGGPARGRLAITNYEVVEVLGNVSMVRLRTETGRTHQIRVHMAHIGHAIVGDRQYGRRKNAECRSEAETLSLSKGQMLHAELLAFRHPRNGKKIKFTAPLPDDIKEVIKSLKGERTS